MKYHKNQWVIIKETGKLGKIVQVWDDGDYCLEVDEIRMVDYLIDSELSPAPKTWSTIEVGDVILDENGIEAKVLEVAENTFLRSGFGHFNEVMFWYTFYGAEKYGWKIKGAEEKVEELTMEEVCKALGKNIKIKKS